jgi:hypothetical protein
LQLKHLPYSHLFLLRMRHGEEMEEGKGEKKKGSHDHGLLILQSLLPCLAKHQRSIRLVIVKYFSTTICLLRLLLPR